MLALCVVGVALFTGLGVWQVKRLFWKLDLIARVEARIHADPVAAPTPEAFAAEAASEAEYRRVGLSGHFLNDRETLVQAVTELGGGFWVLTPFVTTRGFIVLVNRGFVPPEKRAPESRAAGTIEGPTSLTGLLRLSEPGGGFLRRNDPGHERWYSRDVAAISAARGLDGGAGYFVDADRAAGMAGFPAGGLTVTRFSNNHLVYALTWFALAVMSAVGAYLVWRKRAR
ncbi:SURF1 family protein [Ancylobacter pratisalsi]|uniref:SURF1-like protein n=1 Tax=Ancylobacter pratisalsi TaxID=1745854 RepID=A0A6P1YSZ5_9HYPH|nr:SURF1 family protein [Ancylobacter pratisalsi]QIB36282.1 SURF1 family protein [Ancylobacter pratisalsi]